MRQLAGTRRLHGGAALCDGNGSVEGYGIIYGRKPEKLGGGSRGGLNLRISPGKAQADISKFRLKDVSVIYFPYEPLLSGKAVSIPLVYFVSRRHIALPNIQPPVAHGIQNSVRAVRVPVKVPNLALRTVAVGAVHLDAFLGGRSLE